ncbi:MAG TPA: nickel transporter [Sutterella sp.]|nr:nickel transporter [Sutterella sp.]
MFDFELVIDSLPLLLTGACVTIEIACISVGLGMVFGLGIGIAEISKNPFIRYPSKAYVDFLRGTPLLVQIFMIYFALPVVIGTRIDPFVAAIAACSINSSAYVAEIFRAGVQSIDRGQMEAARSLGLTWKQAMKFVVIPQAFKRVIPPLGNEFIAMLKDSSLVSVIGFEELTRQGQLIIASTYGAIEIWTCVALLYLAMTIPITRLVAVLEKKFAKNDRN